MSFLNKNNKKISFESSEFISELKNDIAEFGENIILYVWYKIIDGVKIYVNYDFIIDDMPLTKKEINSGEIIIKMKAGELLKKLEIQNKIIWAVYNNGFLSYLKL